MALRRDQRGVLIGQSGTGKSYLAKRLLPVSGRLCIIDPKRLFKYNHDIEVYHNVDWLLFNRPDRFIYRPKPDNLTNLYDYNRVYKYVYDRGNFLCYTDDIVGVMNKTRYPHYLQVCYQMGREKNVSMLSAFQRPANVPLFTYTEVNKFWIFTLVSGGDTKRVREWLEDYDPEQLTHQHSFYYRSLFDSKNGRYAILKTGRNQTTMNEGTQCR